MSLPTTDPESSKIKRKAALSCSETLKKIVRDQFRRSSDEDDIEKDSGASTSCFKTNASRRTRNSKRRTKKTEKKLLPLSNKKCDVKQKENPMQLEESTTPGRPARDDLKRPAATSGAKDDSEVTSHVIQKMTQEQITNGIVLQKIKKSSYKHFKYKKSKRNNLEKESLCIQEKSNRTGKTRVKRNFPNWRPTYAVWQPLTHSDCQKYLPQMDRSPSFKVLGSSEVDNSWNVLQLFDSHFFQGDSAGSVFFSGGPVWCLAWCPTSKTVKTVQHIALTSGCSWRGSPPHVSGMPGLIQIWSFTNSKMVAPSLQIAIAHEWEKVFGLKWCPEDAWEDPESKDLFGEGIPRLGLLAVACSDGGIRIYSIPHPEFIERRSDCFPMYRPRPVALLHYSLDQPQRNEFTCTAVSWLQSDDCMKIAGGYSDGILRVFDLRASTLNPKDDFFFPTLTLRAHCAVVTALCFAPQLQGRWLLSSSLDKTIKLWDTIDLDSSATFRCGQASKLQWVPSWKGFCATMINTSFQSAVYYLERLKMTNLTVALHNDASWSTSVSETLKLLARADVVGRVTLNALPSRFPTSGIKRKKKTLVFYSELVKLEGEIRKPHPKDSSCHEDDNDDDNKQLFTNYGIIYNDVFENITATSHKGKETGSEENLGPLNLYPPTSLTCVDWNPNHGYDNYLLIAGQSGLCRLMIMPDR